MYSSAQMLSTLALCGLMGALGQGIRAAVGLKKASHVPSGQVDQQSAFSAAYFGLSLMIGFIAGVLAGMAFGLENFIQFNSIDLKPLIGIAVAGYAGADFIENSMSIVIRPSGSAPAVAPAGGGAASRELAPVQLAEFNANARALANATSALSAALGTGPLLARSTMLGGAPSTVPSFGAALHRVAPGVDLQKWEPVLTRAFQRYGLTSNRRVAAAIGQFVVEAGEAFEEVVENMNYRAERMMEVWPSTFRTLADAEPYAHQPEKLGNFIYANKLGNGDEASGDGYRFRGRGLIQLTGRTEYGEFGDAMGMTAEQASDYCETPEGAAMSGCWYLATRGCLPFADTWDLATITRLVNGKAMLDHAKRVRFSAAMLTQLGG